MLVLQWRLTDHLLQTTNKDCNHVFSCKFLGFPGLVPIKPTSRYVKAWDAAKETSCFQVFSKAMTGNSSKWIPKWNMPSWELTYPLLKALLKIIFLFQRCDIWICYDMLVPRIKANMTSPFLKMHWSILFVWCPPKKGRGRYYQKTQNQVQSMDLRINLEEFWCIKI